MRRLLILPLLLHLAACDSGVESTYPPPGDFPLVTLTELAEAAPGRYTTFGVVLTISECPAAAACDIADNLTIGNDADASPEFTLTVFASRPSQFEIGRTYKFAIEVGEGANASLRYTLLGYAVAESLTDG